MTPIDWTITRRDRVLFALRAVWAFLPVAVVLTIGIGWSFASTDLGMDFSRGFFVGTAVICALGVIWLNSRGIGTTYRFTLAPEGLIVESACVKTIFPWSDMSLADERNFLVFWQGGKCMTWIPKRVFDAEGLTEFLETADRFFGAATSAPPSDIR